MKVLHAVTVPVTARAFLSGQLQVLADEGHEVHLLSAPGAELGALDPRVTVHQVRMTREPDPARDVGALLRAVRVLRAVRPDVTVVGTPKAGLLVGLAAVLVRVPRRYYLLRGLRLETTTGARRLLLTALEVLACRAAHRVVAVSPSLAEEVRRLPGVRADRVVVSGAGSSNGVDTLRFRPASSAQRQEQRRRLGLPEDVVVLGFVGRLGRDKGLRELLSAAERLAGRSDVRWLVVGELEGDATTVDADELRRLGIAVTGFVDDTAPLYAALDVLVLPTYREGFPNVVLEAAASGLPTVTTTATGARDAVVEGVTGLTVPPRDFAALVAALVRLLEDPALRARLGAAARERAVAAFDQRAVWIAYRRLWTQPDLPAADRPPHHDG